jgi:predicted RNase H-like HicB family nuclease
MTVNISLHQDESGWWIAECLNMPGCITQSETRAGALERIKDAIEGWLAVARGAAGDDYSGPIQIELAELEVAA